MHNVFVYFTALFSRFLLDERLGPIGYVGVAFILSGVIASSWLSQPDPNPVNDTVPDTERDVLKAK